jgi:hypothetical protein
LEGLHLPEQPLEWYGGSIRGLLRLEITFTPGRVKRMTAAAE